MNAISIIDFVRASGGEIRTVAGRIKLKVPASLRYEVVTKVAEQKNAIIKALESNFDKPWSGEDYVAFFNERAAIAEHDGGLSRSEVEAQAFECCVTEWLNRNPVCSPPDRCLGGGEAEQPNDPLLPFGAHANGCAWLHKHCWSDWRQARTAQAVAALSAMGIEA